MKKYPVLFFPILFLFSCSQNKNSDATSAASDTTTAKPGSILFFPVTSFIQGQIGILDSLPVTILRVDNTDNRRDSAWLPAAKVKPQLQPFLADIIGKDNLTGLFKETKFNDQSTEAITFMYDPKTTLPDSMALRRWDVYVDPDNGTVKRIYILKQVKENNTMAMQQLTWQTGKWAKIVTIKNEPGAKPEEIKWIWDLNGETIIPSADKSGEKEK